MKRPRNGQDTAGSVAREGPEHGWPSAWVSRHLVPGVPAHGWPSAWVTRHQEPAVPEHREPSAGISRYFQPGVPDKAATVLNKPLWLAGGQHASALGARITEHG